VKKSNLDCFFCLQRQHSDWAVLTDEELDLLSSAQTGYRYRSGERIYAMGEPMRGVHCICSGAVAIRQLDAEGNSVLLQLAYPGDTLGYNAFLGGGDHKTTAEAIGESTICLIDRDTVWRLLDKNPSLGLNFLRRSDRDLSEAREKLVQNATLSNRAKFIHLLLVLSHRFGRLEESGEVTLELPLSRRDMASMIGTRHETLSRIITRLQEDGVVRFSGRSVRIPELDALMARIGPQLVG